ncbi:HutD/Ves family protein [Bradyrhizobium prioriisuperbiae]|uniref:HutD/Ves family protein n=1 Tax=Bradyrhizobium prioriisuperbiae TaxID=2854389 RepID=UPI0028ECDCC9|nr:HutD family protein [Bradyrhizobium prioritasuperba]
MTLTITRLDPEGYRRLPWKNGGGTLIDIADAYRADAPRDWDSLLWKFGRTAIVAPGPFSHLPGITRMQMVVKGEGLILEAADAEFDERRAFTPVRFAGELAIVTRLETGPVDVVNLMANAAAFAIDLVALTQPGTRGLAAGSHVIYAPAGDSFIEIDGAAFPLRDDHALRFDPTSSAQLSLISGLVVVGSIFAV